MDEDQTDITHLLSSSNPLAILRLLRFFAAKLVREYGDPNFAGLGNGAAEHGASGIGECRVAVAVEGDDAAGAPRDLGETGEDFVGCFLDGVAAVLDAGGNVGRDGVANEEFPLAGARDGARFILGIGTGEGEL